MPKHIEQEKERLASLQELAKLHLKQGEIDNAEREYQETLRGKEKAYGPMNPTTLDTASRLASLYLNSKRKPEAAELYRRVLDGRAKVLGRLDKLTIDARNNLGVALLGTVSADIAKQGHPKVEEAQKLFEQAWYDGKKCLGDDGSSTVLAIHCLGWLNHRRGMLGKSVKLYQLALSRRIRSLGAAHEQTRFTARKLGNVFEELGDLSKAEDMYQMASQPSESKIPAWIPIFGFNPSEPEIRSKQAASVTRKRSTGIWTIFKGRPSRHDDDGPEAPPSYSAVMRDSPDSFGV
jgi:tetratricopeptide (TPR) repeat protein